MLKLPGHSRYAYSPIVKRTDYSWPGGKRLAFYVALNIEHFAFGAGRDGVSILILIQLPCRGRRARTTRCGPRCPANWLQVIRSRSFRMLRGAADRSTEQNPSVVPV